MHKIIGVMLLLVAAVCGCSPQAARFSRTYDLNSPKYTIGVQADCDSEYLTRKIYRDAKVKCFESLETAAKQLMAGKIDAIVYDEHVLRRLMWKYPNRFAFLSDPVDTDPSVVAVSPKRPELVEKLNAFIAQYRESGLYDDMFLRWCHDPERETDGVEDMPEIPSAPEDAPVLRVGTDCDEEPNSYYDEKGRISGFDTEFCLRFGAAENVRIEFVCLSENEIYDALEKGELDFAADNFDYRPDMKKALYTNGYLDSDVVMMVRAEDAVND